MSGQVLDKLKAIEADIDKMTPEEREKALQEWYKTKGVTSLTEYLMGKILVKDLEKRVENLEKSKSEALEQPTPPFTSFNYERYMKAAYKPLVHVEKTSGKKRLKSDVDYEYGSKIVDLLVCPSKIISVPSQCESCWKAAIQKFITGPEVPGIIELAINEYNSESIDINLRFGSRTREEIAQHLKCPQFRIKRCVDNPTLCDHQAMNESITRYRCIPFEDGNWDPCGVTAIKDQGRFAVFDMERLRNGDRQAIALVRFAYFMSILDDPREKWLTDDLRAILVKYIGAKMDPYTFTVAK
jgi:hypothetical protein